MTHSSLSDIAVYNPATTTVPKKDPFKEGVRVYMGATNNAICLIKTVVSNLMM